MQAVAASAHGINKKKDQEAVARNLKVYIQHAFEFYDGARTAKSNTAPLIYYYSFLNLAKALCEMRNPRFHKREECYRHGVSWRPNPKYLVDPQEEVISVTTRGVWHMLWESLMRKPCVAANPTRLSIKDLFSYCPEISIEYERSFGKENRLIDIENTDVLYDETANEAWLKFSVNRFELKSLGLSAPSLIAQIRTPRSDYKEVRSLKRELRTFESATAKRIEPGQKILGALHSDILGLNVFTHLGVGKKLMYSLPDQRGLPIRLPQLMVMYTILFWLGSLVRYDPHSVGDLMDSEYWSLLDGFMSQSRLWMLELFEWALYWAETTLLLAR